MSADLTRHRFCPRCAAVTVWDTPGDGVSQCTSWPVGADTHCGFTFDQALTVEEWRNAQEYERRLNPREPKVADRADPDLVSRPVPYELV